MPYLISYVLAGLLLALAAALHSRVNLKKLAIRSLVILVFWPFLALIAHDFFSNKTNGVVGDPDDKKGDPVSLDLSLISAEDISKLSKKERCDLMRLRKSGQSHITVFPNHENFDDVLLHLWDYEVPPESYNAVKKAKSKLEHEVSSSLQSPDEDDYAEEVKPANEFDREDVVLFSRREPDWYIGFSTEVVKSISKLDKNNRARLLEAIQYLAMDPVTPLGDTVKPLTGEMAGLWRYRLGDYRLIYKPNAQSKQITLISFGARGGIY